MDLLQILHGFRAICVLSLLEAVTRCIICCGLAECCQDVVRECANGGIWGHSFAFRLGMYLLHQTNH
jgi:hypothetical protein